MDELKEFIEKKIENKSKYYQNIFNLSVEHYKFYNMVNTLLIKDSKNHPNYFDIFYKKFPSFDKEELKLFFFRILRDLPKVQISLSRKIGKECLDYFNDFHFSGKIIINIYHPLKIIPIINQRVDEIYFRKNVPDFEEKE